MSLVDNSIAFSRLSLIKNATISIVELPREFQKNQDMILIVYDERLE